MDVKLSELLKFDDAERDVPKLLEMTEKITKLLDYSTVKVRRDAVRTVIEIRGFVGKKQEGYGWNRTGGSHIGPNGDYGFFSVDVVRPKLELPEPESVDGPERKYRRHNTNRPSEGSIIRYLTEVLGEFVEVTETVSYQTHKHFAICKGNLHIVVNLHVTGKE